MSKAAIIGSGIAGMATAIRLRMQGWEVKVYEKNAAPGGKIGELTQDGFHFDTGPSLFTEPANLHELFECAGESIENYFRYNSHPVSCRYFYSDGTIVSTTADAEATASEIAGKLGEKREDVVNYLNRSTRAYQQIGPLFMEQPVRSVRSFFRRAVVGAVKATRPGYLTRSLHNYNASFFRDPRTVQLFNRYATYNGSDPYRAPAMLSMIPHLEHCDGVFYPEGGMVSICEAVYKLALAKGVRFHFNSPVTRIIRHEKKVRGLVVNGKNVPADVVVSNLDAYMTYKYLLNDAYRAGKIVKQERSSSAVVFYWGINKTFPELDLHNIFFAGDYRSEFAHIFGSKKPYRDPTVYVNITSKCEPGRHAPEGKENWFVMVNAPSDTRADWSGYVSECREAVLQKLSAALGEPIETLIETEAVLDPSKIEANSGAYSGSLYGPASNSRLSAFLRHPNRALNIDGLYFAGGSVHPGGGIPLCLKSAAIVAKSIGAPSQKAHA